MRHRFVFIHGWGGSRNSLGALAKELQRLFPQGSDLSLYMLELPGFGDTPIVEELNLKAYGKFVLENISLIDGATDDSIQLVFIGHSVGGKILLQLASSANLPTHSQLVLIDSSGINPKNSLKKNAFKFISSLYAPLKLLLLRLGLGKLQDFLQRVFYKFVVRARDYEKLNDKPLLKTTFKNIIEEHISIERLQRIAQKVLILWGADDQVTPAWMATELNDNIKNSEKIIIPNGKHGLPLQQPELCAKYIFNFLQN